MKEYKQSTFFFTIKMVILLILACPTFGLTFIWMIYAWLKFETDLLTLNENEVTIKTGVLSKQVNAIKYSKINSVVVTKKWWINIGDIIIFAGNDIAGIRFSNIDNPFQVKAAIDAKIN